MTNDITPDKCKFIVLCELPNGKVCQVLIPDEKIRMALRMYGKFTVYDTEITNIEFE